MTPAEWLEKEFFPVIDRGRLERGKRLYRKGNPAIFRKNEDGFSAVVQGSRAKSYEVDAYLSLDKTGLPDIEEMSVVCSCPDWVEFCKHSVCAVIRYCEEQPSMLPDSVEREEVEDVRKAITRDLEKITDLGPFFSFRGGGSVEEMHRIVQKKLRNHSY
ncbi:MAG TPA: hypothetical protein VFK33_09295 [Bacillales bacterium]|nr:hypothetical protein [Bacillales bacterium]